VPEKRWLDFVPLPAPSPLASRVRRTKLWAVVRRDSGARLGTVRWFARWRQYVLEPATEFGTLWSAGCLEEVRVFLADANLEHRAALADAPP
jgi:hypothetical protein